MALGRDHQDSVSWRATLLWLAAILVLALALRMAFNVESSYDETTGRFHYSGNDPYYHDRTVLHIITTGESLLHDDAINYPHGAGNPNPPIMDWVAAPLAGALAAGGMSLEGAVGLSLNLSAAIWGALLVIPVYVIGTELFGRRAGLWAAFLMAVSGPHIQRASFGFADHDATTIFFIGLAMAFLVKGLRALDHREYVTDWRHHEARMQGVRNAFAHNQRALTWSVLAGVALSATALTWKGYPYVLAIMGVAVFLQLLLDHARNKDSTAMFAFYLIPLILVAILPYPYYANFPAFLESTIAPGLYVLLGVVVMGLILVPTRDLPSILVFPALALVGLIGLALLLIPGSPLYDLGRTIFSGLGYFQQSKLYSTIAEAQRTQLGKVAASFGFFTFLIAFWIYGRSIRFAWKGNEAHMLMVAWGAVGLFMAFAADRFVMNASPIFAVLAGAGVAILWNKIGFGTVRKRFRSQHGQNAVTRSVRSLTWGSSFGALGIALLIVLPNLWIGVDAAMPSEFEEEHDLSPQRWGAFGLSFGMESQGWLGAMNHLAEEDQDQRLEQRPGVMAWWDYGHWITNVGKHPAVADPFQNHYNIAGRFLASETEEEGMAWLTLLILDGHHHRNQGYSSEVRDVLEEHAAGLADEGRLGLQDEAYEALRPHLDNGTTDVYALYDDLTEASGLDVGYFAVDARMWPFDERQTGIFYAPVYLANKNPDEFLQTRYISQDQQTIIELHQYGMDQNNNSFRLERAQFLDQNDQEWEVFGQRAWPKGSVGDPDTEIQVQPLFQPTQKFQNSMYARAYGGPSADSPAADGLSHWRLFHQTVREGPQPENRTDDFRQVAILQYYRGSPVEGRVVDEDGRPVEGATVTFEDGSGARHATTETDPNGEFRVMAPFAVDDDLTLVVSRDGVDIAQQSEPSFQFTREQTRAGEGVRDIEVVVPLVDLEGFVYEDLDGNGTYDPEADRPIADAVVEAEGRSTTTDAEGRYRFENLQPGSAQVRANATGYTARTQSIDLAVDETAQGNISLQPRPVDVEVTLLEDGQPVEQVPVDFQGPQQQSATTDQNGTARTTLSPGEYTVTVDFEFTDSEGNTVAYDLEETLELPFGSETRSVTYEVQRQAPQQGPEPQPEQG